MLWNHIIVALRNLRKNKAFAAINISGLALGLTIYVFGGLLIEYEETHDQFFENASRIYTIGATAAPDLNVGVDKLNSVFTTVGPIIEAELQDIDAVARTVGREFLLSTGEESFYEGISFSDPALLQIFDFNYIHGDASAIEDPSGILITESMAIKYFGKTAVLGEVFTFDNEFDFSVTAVIEDVPLNSHFTSSVIGGAGLDFIAPLAGLNRMRDWDLAGNWDNLSIGNMTYILLPDSLDSVWLQTQMDGIFERMVPEEQRQVIADFIVNPLTYANLAIWDMMGLPIASVVALLSLLVLVVACVNYANLATAQSLGRSREVGMRKTMGASRNQLLTQFLIESLVIATIAMVFSIASLEILIPLFNNAAGKNLTLDYVATMPWLLSTTAIVGLFAGLYPAWLITRTNPIEALRDIARKGKKGSLMRSIMIGTQFAISAFMLALVSIVYMQNESVKEGSYIFPRSEIYTIGRLRVEGITDRLDTLRHELEALPNINSVAYSAQVPFEQNNSSMGVALQPGDKAGEFILMNLRMNPEFLDTYDIPLLAGRNLSRDIGNDVAKEESETINVLVNELALPLLGVDKPIDALNKRFYTLNDEEENYEFIVVGVVPTQNIVGLFNKEKPWLYQYSPDSLRIGSIRITGGNVLDTVTDIEDVWNRVIPEYPIQGRFLDEVFNDIYNVLKYMNMALAGFAFVALSLALIGLFGLAAFMAAQRTKEIGVRKVLGASSMQIARLLVWQFSTPILIVSGLIAVMLAWLTIAGHAIRIARSNPILALRYE